MERKCTSKLTLKDFLRPYFSTTVNRDNITTCSEKFNKMILVSRAELLAPLVIKEFKEFDTIITKEKSKTQTLLIVFD